MASSLVSHRLGLPAALETHHLLSLVAQWISVAVILLFAMTVPLPPRDSRRTLQVTEQFGQLFISWAPGQDGRMDISDGGVLTTLNISRHLTGVTYTRHNNEVEIRLADLESRRAPQLTRFVTYPDGIETKTAALYKEMNGLFTQTQQLRLSTRNDRDQLLLMQLCAHILLDRTALVARQMQSREKQPQTSGFDAGEEVRR
jgi:hypothetical protein